MLLWKSVIVVNDVPPFVDFCKAREVELPVSCTIFAEYEIKAKAFCCNVNVTDPPTLVAVLDDVSNDCAVTVIAPDVVVPDLTTSVTPIAGDCATKFEPLYINTWPSAIPDVFTSDNALILAAAIRASAFAFV